MNYKKPHNKQSALVYALKEDNETLVEQLLQEGADPNVAMPPEDYVQGAQYPLMAAARQKNPTTLQLLIDHGLIIEGPKSLLAALYENCSPSFPSLFSRSTHTRTVATMKLLLKHGADIHGGNKENTPLSNAIILGATDIARLFLVHHKKNNLPAAHLIPALHIAIECHNNKLVALLIKYGADPHSIYENETGLSRAICEQQHLEQAIKHLPQESNKKIIKLLIDNGAKRKY